MTTKVIDCVYVGKRVDMIDSCDTGESVYKRSHLAAVNLLLYLCVSREHEALRRPHQFNHHSIVWILQRAVMYIIMIIYFNN